MTILTHCAILRETYLDYPNEVSLETYTRCNADCEFCPYSTLERVGTRMPDALIDRLIGEMAQWPAPFGFSPFKVNEPLLDKRTLPLIERINREVPRARIRLFSNGTTLNEANLDRIAGLRIHHLWVSLNSVDPEERARVMRLRTDTAWRNLDALHARTDFPHHVVLSKVGHPDADFRAYCRKRWPRFQASTLKRDAWIDFTTAHETEVPNEPCSRWFEISICADGKVALCCMDGEGKYAIGDLNHQTMLEVYNEPSWRLRRAGLLNRKLFSPCDRCTYGA